MSGKKQSPKQDPEALESRKRAERAKTALDVAFANAGTVTEIAEALYRNMRDLSGTPEGERLARADKSELGGAVIRYHFKLLEFVDRLDERAGPERTIGS